MNTRQRGLSQQFMDALQGDTGLGLDRIVSAVKGDSTLSLAIRKDYINIYYRGGNLMRLAEVNGHFAASFDKNYSTSNTAARLPPTLLATASDVALWLDSFPVLKHTMDLWFGRNPKAEREAQQMLVRENNSSGKARGTDYFICDLEYANAQGRFDLVAAYWPSSGAARKNNKDVGLAFVEMKYGDGALVGNAGIAAHISDLRTYLNAHASIVPLLKDEIKHVFNQKHEFGLIDNQKQIQQFNDKKPEYMFVFANHDPDSTILYRELKKLETIANALPFELKFAASSFMGYGLYRHNIYGLTDFLDHFSGRIFAKASE